MYPYDKDKTNKEEQKLYENSKKTVNCEGKKSKSTCVFGDVQNWILNYGKNEAAVADPQEFVNDRLVYDTKISYNTP